MLGMVGDVAQASNLCSDWLKSARVEKRGFDWLKSARVGMRNSDWLS